MNIKIYHILSKTNAGKKPPPKTGRIVIYVSRIKRMVSISLVLFLCTIMFPAVGETNAPQTGNSLPHFSVDGSPVSAGDIRHAENLVVSSRLQLVHGQIFQECPVCPKMVVIGAGEFEMGTLSDDENRTGIPHIPIDMEQPRHPVTMHLFAIGVYPVTKAEFASAVAEMGDIPKQCKVYVKRTFKLSLENDWRNPGFEQTDADPVVCVSWDDAQRYIAWLNGKIRGHGQPLSDPDGPYHLPTEEEWEYAARAGTSTVNYWGDDPTQQCKFVNGADLNAKKQFPALPFIAECVDGFATTSPVGSFPPNAWNLYDMVGNVFEWSNDCWSDDYSERITGEPLNPRENCAHHTMRGGGWVSPPNAMRPASRTRWASETRQSAGGFRVVRSLTLQEEAKNVGR